MADIVQQLREIATGDPDPARRQEAARRLHRRGESVSGGPMQDALRGKVAESLARTERLRGEQGDYTGGLGDLNRAARDVAAAPGESASTLARDVSVGLNEGLNAATFGLYNRAVEGAYEAVSPEMAEEFRAQRAAAPEIVKSTGRALPALAAGAGVAQQMARPWVQAALAELPWATRAAATGATTGATAFPVGMSRRMAEGEDLEQAAKGAGAEAAVAAALPAAEALGGRILGGAADRLTSGVLGSRLGGKANRAIGQAIEQASPLRATIEPMSVPAVIAVANPGQIDSDDLMSRMPEKPAPPRNTDIPLPPDMSMLSPPDQLRAAAQYSKAKQRALSNRLMRKRPKPKREEFTGQTVDPITGEVLE